LVLFILGLFVFLALIMRTDAKYLTLDENGIQLEYIRGGAYTRNWGGLEIRVSGRWTEGTPDSVSSGRAIGRSTDDLEGRLRLSYRKLRSKSSSTEPGSMV
jgi:hypothetical protein